MPPAALRHRNLPLLLLRAREALMTQFRPDLHREGLTDQQWRIVRTLCEDGPLEPRQLCERCQISSPSIAGVLARMEEMGLVRRERMASDQRRVRVSPSPRSRHIARRIAPLAEARYREIENAVGADVLGELYGLLDQLLARIDPKAHAPAAAAPAATSDEPVEPEPWTR